MRLPFTAEQFFDVFRLYNEAVWPAQFLLAALGLGALLLVFTPNGGSSRVVSSVLALLWAWLAVVYHVLFFSRINPLAYGFGAVSFAGALVFVWQGVIRGRLRFAWRGGVRGATGLLLAAFALMVYPLWSWSAGHRYPAMPTFGLPCPTTIFTLGMLAFVTGPYPRSPFVVPMLWCFVGVQAALLLGVRPDLALIPAAVAGIVLMAKAGASREERGIS